HAPMRIAREDLERRVAAVPIWYHTLELADGVMTPGYFDMRPFVREFGFPQSMAGMRVVDVGASDSATCATKTRSRSGTAGRCAEDLSGRGNLFCSGCLHAPHLPGAADEQRVAAERERRAKSQPPAARRERACTRSRTARCSRASRRAVAATAWSPTRRDWTHRPSTARCRTRWTCRCERSCRSTTARCCPSSA